MSAIKNAIIQAVAARTAAGLSLVDHLYYLRIPGKLPSDTPTPDRPVVTIEPLRNII